MNEAAVVDGREVGAFVVDGPGKDGMPSGSEGSSTAPGDGIEETRPASERIADLFERMHPARRILRGLIAYCREGRTADEVATEVGRLQERDFSIYDAPVLCSMLQHAGALQVVVPDRPEVRVVEENGASYIEPASVERAAERWASTADGLAALQDGDAALGRFWNLLADNGRYRHIYQTVLTCCANDGGATVGELSDAVDGDPEVQSPRLYAQYFLNGLADCDLLEWNGSWCITDLGRRAAEALDECATA